MKNILKYIAIVIVVVAGTFATYSFAAPAPPPPCRDMCVPEDDTCGYVQMGQIYVCAEHTEIKKLDPIGLPTN